MYFSQNSSIVRLMWFWSATRNITTTLRSSDRQTKAPKSRINEVRFPSSLRCWIIRTRFLRVLCLETCCATILVSNSCGTSQSLRLRSPRPLATYWQRRAGGPRRDDQIFVCISFFAQVMWRSMLRIHRERRRNILIFACVFPSRLHGQLLVANIQKLYFRKDPGRNSFLIPFSEFVVVCFSSRTSTWCKIWSTPRSCPCY